MWFSSFPTLKTLNQVVWVELIMICMHFQRINYAKSNIVVYEPEEINIGWNLCVYTSQKFSTTQQNDQHSFFSLSFHYTIPKACAHTLRRIEIYNLNGIRN